MTEEEECRKAIQAELDELSRQDLIHNQDRDIGSIAPVVNVPLGTFIDKEGTRGKRRAELYEKLRRLSK
jgi:hypothetical protein